VNKTIQISGKRLALSNLDKVLYPSGRLTKAHVLDYYRRIASTILPYLKDRPLTLVRYPEGVENDFFFEKRCPSHRPKWVKTIELPTREEEPLNACLVNDLETLIWVENLASLELHVPLSRGDAIEHPDMMVFDLDPGPPATILDCARLALLLRDLLSQMDLKSYIKTSGKLGLHLYVPLDREETTYEDTKRFSRAIAELLERNDPGRVTAKMAKEYRRGKVFINWSQNDSSKTMVCVYSLRAREKPFVSFPLRWNKVEEWADRNALQKFHILYSEALERLGAMGDLFQPVLLERQKLPLDFLRA
jgi:bifunctional non-homologous end joining protein LigD